MSNEQNLREFSEWLDTYRDLPVHEVFHEIVLRYEEALATTEPAVNQQLTSMTQSQPVPLTDEWVSVGDQKPPTNKPVLLHYLDEHQRSKIVRAHYIPAKTVEAGEDDAAEEYDAESDTYFVQEGWYEDNSESEVNYGITGQITHWRNLPLVPAIIAAQPAAPAMVPLLVESDLKWLKRFKETTEDDQSYDVPKDAIKRLAELGAVRWVGGSRYAITAFGVFVADPDDRFSGSLPLKTYADHMATSTGVLHDNKTDV